MRIRIDYPNGERFESDLLTVPEIHALQAAGLPVVVVADVPEAEPETPVEPPADETTPKEGDA